ncbi:hypothetical protein NPIL_424671 [Nephila pilipes]|uniref:Uncharacterized protein n=1 Tax=Nephila pilipes TaxID=299642 RepID=A0A8X6QAR8_NEPPI|nr:hypothetical protein NPIL_424671 [Nephila pilipes]
MDELAKTAVAPERILKAKWWKSINHARQEQLTAIANSSPFCPAVRQKSNRDQQGSIHLSHALGSKAQPIPRQTTPSPRATWLPKGKEKLPQGRSHLPNGLWTIAARLGVLNYCLLQNCTCQSKWML